MSSLKRVGVVVANRPAFNAASTQTATNPQILGARLPIKNGSDTEQKAREHFKQRRRLGRTIDRAGPGCRTRFRLVARCKSGGADQASSGNDKGSSDGVDFHVVDPFGFDLCSLGTPEAKKTVARAAAVAPSRNQHLASAVFLFGSSDCRRYFDGVADWKKQALVLLSSVI